MYIEENKLFETTDFVEACILHYFGHTLVKTKCNQGNQIEFLFEDLKKCTEKLNKVRLEDLQVRPFAYHNSIKYISKILAKSKKETIKII